jgi:ribosome-binding protein aMBF1 (putative translation factor)
MPQHSSQIVIASRSHGTAVEKFAAVVSQFGMPSELKILADRLTITREALGLIPAELCRRIKCKPNRWSQYETGERKLTLEIEMRLCDEFGLSLDWIYRGDPSRLPHELRLKMRRTA